MSTAEAGYVSLSACCAQVIWMRTQLLNYGYKYNRILMYRDSKSVITISCNPVQHSKTKHIDIRYHFIKEHVEKGTMEIYFVRTEYQLADLFTKALPKERFEYLVHRIVIIMAQQQHATDVHPDELCPLNKRYDLMDANKKVDLDRLLSYVSMDCNRAQFWHTLKEDGSKYQLRFMLDKRELTLTLDDFRQNFHLPQATANNHNSFMPTPSFSDMVPFYKQVLGLQLELKTQSNFKTAGLLQLWQTLCKIFSKCLTTRVTGWDQPPLQIMQMLNDEPKIPGTRIEPQSDKESPEVEISKEKEVEISKEKEVEQTNVVIPVNVNDEDEEITDEVYELKRLEKGKIVEETRNSPILTPIRSLRIHINLVSSDTEKLQELTDTPHTTSS
ncbi:hypothetical protein Tco_0277949 [Tanacetum coccineum]